MIYSPPSTPPPPLSAFHTPFFKFTGVSLLLYSFQSTKWMCHISNKKVYLYNKGLDVVFMALWNFLTSRRLIVQIDTQTDRFFWLNSICLQHSTQHIHLIYTVQRHHTLHLHNYYITSFIIYTIRLKLRHPSLHILHPTLYSTSTSYTHDL